MTGRCYARAPSDTHPASWSPRRIRSGTNDEHGEPMRKREEAGVWWASPHAAAIAAFIPAVMSIFVIIHQLTLSNVINGASLPGAGTNFSSAMALAGGQLPYNTYPTSFPLTQPPGMTLILLPFAFIAHGGNVSGA